MTPQRDIRAELVRLMAATMADRQHWTYRAVRPLPLPDQWHPGLAISSDCSFGVKLLCRWAGAPDPTGYGHDQPYGNSESICLHLQHLGKPVDLLPGDVVTFGRGGRSHAAMVHTPGGDPLLWSDGHQGAPNFYRLSTDTREHQLLRLPVRKPIATPEDKLRAKTGYWSWLSWKQGEGVNTWKPYGPSNKTVRPDVPKLIPPAWWAARIRFLRARKKGDRPTTS